MKTLKIFFILILFSQIAFSQDRIVFGVIKDSSDIPAPGATVLVEGTKKYTQTNFDGFYSIKVSSDQFLIFTYVGMVPQRISASKNEIDVILQIDHNTILSDIIPPLIQTKKPKDLKSATKSISAEDIEKPE
ncbi:carboxypeptidase-like regulatory domain-containing protein [Flavobacterium sp. SH_e]|uniref:carboxypeptidase-like regulatory domain-containing protein n=1 Tax=Flavobacterium TaxID=237 RepID=UPI0021E3AEEE|nr:carboxypeptidase-like regulatory domain-containing protein [Flavobacterium sp. SH_e]MCV2485142.1 carboxypeptidase-like regulatory domain-containing protein [Flavobacterium sp. SH_e]